MEYFILMLVLLFFRNREIRRQRAILVELQ